MGFGEHHEGVASECRKDHPQCCWQSDDDAIVLVQQTR